MAKNGPRTIKLFCPSLSTTIPFFAWDEQRLDIGSIARTFGLEPSTVKLNRHFISRGADLVSSSVTWKSLLSFFTAKGLPTGNSDEDPLLVDGKLCKVGIKRVHDPQEVLNRNNCEAAGKGGNLNGRRQTPEISSVKNKKFKYRDLGSKHVEFPVSKYNPNCNKRKLYMEDVIQLKKLKINETKSGTDSVGGINDLATAIPRSPYLFSCNSANMKRMRDEPLVSALCKRTR